MAVRIFFYFILIFLSTNSYSLERIKIGIIAEKKIKHLAANYFPEISQDALNLLIEEYKEKFLSKGIIIELEYFQLNKDAISAVSATRKAINSDIVAAVGLPISKYALVGGKILKKSNLTVIAPYASSSKLINYQPNLLLTSLFGGDISKYLEKYITKDLKTKKVVLNIVTWDRNYSKTLYQSFSESYKSKNTLVKTTEKNPDLKGILNTYNKHKPDVIFVPNFPVANVKIIKMLVNNGFKGNFVAPATWGDSSYSNFDKLMGGFKYNGYTLRSRTQYSISRKESEFRNRLTSIYNKEYSVLAANYYESLKFILDRMLAVKGKVTRGKLNKLLLEKPSTDTMFGKVCFIKGKRCDGEKINVVKVVEGKWSFHKSFGI